MKKNILWGMLILTAVANGSKGFSDEGLFFINSDGIGPFTYKHTIHLSAIRKEYPGLKFTESQCEQGEGDPVPCLKVVEGNKIVMTVYFNNHKIPEEIRVQSERIKTRTGIGVGSKFGNSPKYKNISCKLSRGSDMVLDCIDSNLPYVHFFIDRPDALSFEGDNYSKASLEGYKAGLKELWGSQINSIHWIHH